MIVKFARCVIFLALLPAAGGWYWPREPVQEPPPDARLVAFTLDPQAPEFGQVFQLELTVRIAPGLVTFVPDTLLPAAASVSARSGDWSETPGPADSIDVRARYPVMGFLNGRVDLPSLELLTRPVLDDEASGPRSVSVLDEAGPASRFGLRRLEILVGATQIAPLSALSEAGDNLSPRPPADVLGGQWSIWFLSAVGLSIIAGALVLWFVISRSRLASAAAHDGQTLRRSPRREALDELDRIRALGWHREGRFIAFYEGSTGALRRFSEQDSPKWGTALTSTELLGRIRARWGPEPVQDLASSVTIAEWVKFGEHRPDIETAEGHWMTIRNWIEGMPEV